VKLCVPSAGRSRKLLLAHAVTVLGFLSRQARDNVLLTDYIPKLKTPWSESASELYRPSDRRLSTKLVRTFADRRCHVLILCLFLGERRNLSTTGSCWCVEAELKQEVTLPRRYINSSCKDLYVFSKDTLCPW
jgi:hypothetical protein